MIIMNGIVNDVTTTLKHIQNNKEENKLVMCVLKNLPFWLMVRLRSVDTDDRGDGCDYLFQLTLFNNNNVVFDNDPLLNVEEVFDAFENFSNGFESSYIFCKS